MRRPARLSATRRSTPCSSAAARERPCPTLRNAADGVVVDGVGIGHEELGDDDVLEAGMTLAVERTAADVLSGTTVVITADGHEAL